jgi:membrane peptidoglycan carboxypeptidase
MNLARMTGRLDRPSRTSTLARDRAPRTRRRPRIDLAPFLAALAILVTVSSVGGGMYVASFMRSLPPVTGLDATLLKGDTLIYDRNGVELADVGRQGNHLRTVPLSQISPYLINATVAVEDHTFWTNPGFDPTGIVRSAIDDILHRGTLAGGSTITQQLVKQVFLSPQQTLSRKLREVVLAYQMTRTYSKQQILQLYLNVSPYGEQQFGVEAAAETYFHKSAKELDLAQASLLAGLPRSPTDYDPITHFSAAKARQQEVLAAMVRYGYISARQAQAAYAEPLQVYPPVTTYKAPHFVQYVLAELEQLGFKPGQQQLVVKTTLDYRQQQLAEQVVRRNVAAQARHDPGGQLSSAMVAIDPKTGEILSMVGSPDFNGPGGQFNFAATHPINPGSSLKPFTYALALQNRELTMNTKIHDGPSPYVVKLPTGEVYSVQNFDLKTHGDPPARVALAGSLNIPAIKVEMLETVPALVDFLRKVGIQPIITHTDKAGEVSYSSNDPDTAFGPSLTLGGYPVLLVQEAAGYAALADLGLYHPPISVLQVTDLKGHVLYQADPTRNAVQVMDPGVAFIISQILSDDANRAPIFGFNSPLHLADRQAAAKTGTTDNYKDALTAGYTPDLASVFWVGDILDASHHMNVDAVFVASPAWHDFMEAALQGVPNHWYQPPADVVAGPGDSWFLRGTTNLPTFPGDTAPSPQASAAPPSYNVPPDPGTGPQVAGIDCRHLAIPVLCPRPAPPSPPPRNRFGLPFPGGGD